MIVAMDVDPDSARFRELIERVSHDLLILLNLRGDRFTIYSHNHETMKVRATSMQTDSDITTLTYGFISNQFAFAEYVEPNQQMIHQWGGHL